MIVKRTVLPFLIMLLSFSFGCITYRGIAKNPKDPKAVAVGQMDAYAIIIYVISPKVYEVDVNTGETAEMEVQYE